MPSLADPVHLAVKAGVASALAVVACRGLGLDDPLSAGFVALACVSPSAYAGVRSGLVQLAGSMLGSAVAGLPLLVWPSLHGAAPALVASLGAAVLGCIGLGLEAGILVAGFTVLYVHLLPYAALVSIGERSGAVALGVAAATGVNVVVSAVNGRRIVARRLARAREAVRGALEAAAGAVLGGRPLPARDEFAGAFQTVAALRDDLGGAAREGFFPGAARARESAARGLAVAEALEDAAHLAKEVAALAGERPLEAELRGAVAAAVAALAAALGVGVTQGPASDAVARARRALGAASEPVLDAALARLERAALAAVG